MIYAISAALGALLGVYRAKKLGGKDFDYLLYATVFAIIFMLITLFLSLTLLRSGT